jgi:hypothetical protein
MQRAPIWIAVLAFLAPSAAWACGGFFCSTSPVDQSAEKIVFYLRPEGVKVFVQISAKGTDPTGFAWVLPVRQVPSRLGVGTQSALDRLAAMTEPSFRLEVQETGECNPHFFSIRRFGGLRGQAGGAPRSAGAGNVQVISEAVVGPYDSAVLKSDDPGALVQWLRANRFTISDAAAGIIPAYVAEHSLFVAYKLRSNRTTTDLVPVVLDFPFRTDVDGTPLDACIPLRLTAIAATQNMAIETFVLGSAQAVPTNFFRVVLNQAKLDWTRRAQNYVQVMQQGLSEVGGNGFVTEYAGSTRLFRQAFYAEGRFDLTKLRATTDPGEYVDLLLRQGFPRDGQMRLFLRKWMPLPPNAGIPERQFYNCVRCYPDIASRIHFDPAAATDDLEMTVVEPLREFQHAFDASPYVTRLRTYISPAQMTRDPRFGFSSRLPEVSNIHVAKGVLQCGLDGGWGRSPLQLTLEDGKIVDLLPGLDRVYRNTDLADMPAALIWYRDQDGGTSEVAGTNVTTIAGMLARHNSGVAHGCSASPGATSGTTAAGFAVVILLVAFRSRRARRPPR